ncbi:hypothetical protein MFIFM68171_04698 [Madurella fahalii]|uniref:Glycosyl transferase n=1 Tax=Madurella fahalii TaxID=1157608 RepID=A0ABQ0G9P0_9PEZI
MRTWNSPRPRLLTVALALVALAIVGYGTYYFVKPYRYSYPTFRFNSVPDHACDGADNIENQAGQPKHVIPNFVHYVWLLKDPGQLRLSFQVWLSIYSAHIFWRPERIYLHTDAAPEVIQKARESGTPWTKRILAIPGITINNVEVPKTTRKGVEIVEMEHKSDFLRLAALRDFGGVYLDTDAVPLRDIADLRNSGFANVIGGQTGLSMRFTGYLNNGVMMAAPHSNLMTIFYEAAHEFFDGQWETASIHLLTDLGNRFALIPNEVLILQPQAFDPTSWQKEDQIRLFKEVLDPIATGVGPEDQGQQQSSIGTCRDALAWLKQRENSKQTDPWELDFSSTYVLHAFDNWVPSIIGKDRKIDVKYVLERKSNYARAVFPAVWRAVQEGIIPQDEVS